MNRKPGTFSMQDIADVTGAPRQTVWMHRRNGRFDINDIGSVAGYIISQQLMRRAKHAKPQEHADEQIVG